MRITRSFLRLFPLLLISTACQTAPITGRSQLMIIPEPEEVRMGVQAYQEVLKKSKISRDPQINELVTRVGSRIAQATGRTDYRWEFTVIEDGKQVDRKSVV